MLDQGVDREILESGEPVRVECMELNGHSYYDDQDVEVVNYVLINFRVYVNLIETRYYGHSIVKSVSGTEANKCSAIVIPKILNIYGITDPNEMAHFTLKPKPSEIVIEELP